MHSNVIEAISKDFSLKVSECKNNTMIYLYIETIKIDSVNSYIIQGIRYYFCVTCNLSVSLGTAVIVLF